MQKIALLLIFIFATWGCRQSGKKVTGKQESPDANPAHTLPGKEGNWADSLLINYINHANNGLLKLAGKDTISPVWLFDRIEDTDTAKYLIFQIGHDVSDEGNTNKRFVTDDWIYIDSTTRKIYKYDLPNERLIQWKK